MMDEVLVGPNAADQIERLDEHFARLRLVDGEGFEFRRAEAAPQAEVEAAPRQVVKHRRLLSDEQRVPEWQDVDHVGKSEATRPP